jgi:methyltransferase
MSLPPGPAVALLTLLAVLLVMGGEALLSAFNESVLRSRGAIEPEGDVYRTMQWAYPMLFVVMAIEGAITGPAPRDVLIAGLAIFGFAKALKAWAISSLGLRWTFRVLILKEAPLVTAGPYRLVRHPNYVAVVGEIIGFGAIVRAPITTVLAVGVFGWLMLQRIRVEDRALGRH